MIRWKMDVVQEIERIVIAVMWGVIQNACDQPRPHPVSDRTAAAGNQNKLTKATTLSSGRYAEIEPPAASPEEAGSRPSQSAAPVSREPGIDKEAPEVAGGMSPDWIVDSDSGASPPPPLAGTSPMITSIGDVKNRVDGRSSGDGS